MFKSAHQHICYLSYISIDVAIGATASSVLITKLLEVPINIFSSLILSLTVWSIYTLDHLLDSQRGFKNHLSKRHQLHSKYSKQLTKILILVLLVIGVMLFFIPEITLLYGVILGCFLLAYFLSIHLLKSKFIVHKELVIAIIYTAGICIGPISQMEKSLLPKQYLIIVTLFIIVLFNLLFFSLMDKKNDQSANFPSFVTSMGDMATNLILKILCAVGAISLLTIYYQGLVREGILLTVMFSVLQVIYWNRRHIKVKLYYRYVGDGIFLLPILYFL
jgi:4-hydroxybenzoate polyprenyltransferase